MEVSEVLQNLQTKKNVLLMGAPGTGKSKLMNDIARAFENGANSISPRHVLNANVPIQVNPDTKKIGSLPMMKFPNRKVFRTTLHQNSKYREFLTGIMPCFDGSKDFEVSEGIIYRANEFAKQTDSAALVILDELNRGPAIEVFGGSIVTIEPDKRLDDNNKISTNTQSFELLCPKKKEYVNYAFSPNLFILAAINQADVSVAPLDVAFMRRWMCMRLMPDYSPIYEKFKITKNNLKQDIPDTPKDNKDVIKVAVKALETINQKIVYGRGAEYQLGQGVFLSTSPLDDGLDSTLQFVTDVWMTIFAHIEELFYGDPNAMAYVLNASHKKSPYELKEVEFAGEIKHILNKPEIQANKIYELYLSILEEKQ